MKFEDFEIGKEYELPAGLVVRVIDKAAGEIAVRSTNQSHSRPFFTFADNNDFSGWRPYVPPPAPVVRDGAK